MTEQQIDQAATDTNSIALGIFAKFREVQGLVDALTLTDFVNWTDKESAACFCTINVLDRMLDTLKKTEMNYNRYRGLDVTTVFSCRAECMKDVSEVCASMNDLRGIGFKLTKTLVQWPQHFTESPYVEWHFEGDASPEFVISEIKRVMGDIADTHVMIESLKQCPMEDNDGSRI